MVKYILTLCLCTISCIVSAQDSINWLSFEEMESLFAKNPKKVLIDFRADWCKACLRMEKYVFSKPEIIEKINKDFYAIRFDVESEDSIHFGGKLFINPASNNRKQQTYHELAFLLGKNQDNQLQLPLLILYDKNFHSIKRINQYYNSEELLKTLSKY